MNTLKEKLNDVEENNHQLEKMIVEKEAQERVLNETETITSSGAVTLSWITFMVSFAEILAPIIWIISGNLEILFYLTHTTANYPKNFNILAIGSIIFSQAVVPNGLAIYTKQKRLYVEGLSIFEQNNINSSFLISNGSILISLLSLIGLHLVQYLIESIIKKKLNFINQFDFKIVISIFFFKRFQS